MLEKNNVRYNILCLGVRECLVSVILKISDSNLKFEDNLTG